MEQNVVSDFSIILAMLTVANIYWIVRLSAYSLYYLYNIRRYNGLHKKHIGMKYKFYIGSKKDALCYAAWGVDMALLVVISVAILAKYYSTLL